MKYKKSIFIFHDLFSKKYKIININGESNIDKILDLINTLFIWLNSETEFKNKLNNILFLTDFDCKDIYDFINTNNFRFDDYNNVINKLQILNKVYIYIWYDHLESTVYNLNDLLQQFKYDFNNNNIHQIELFRKKCDFENIFLKINNNELINIDKSIFNEYNKNLSNVKCKLIIKDFYKSLNENINGELKCDYVINKQYEIYDNEFIHFINCNIANEKLHKFIKEIFTDKYILPQTFIFFLSKMIELIY